MVIEKHRRKLTVTKTIEQLLSFQFYALRNVTEDLLNKLNNKERTLHFSKILSV